MLGFFGDAIKLKLKRLRENKNFNLKFEKIDFI
jgi:hypothetical protein